VTEAPAVLPAGWRARRLTLEAMALLALARLLIAAVRFARWRIWLGDVAGPPDTVPAERLDHYYARVVERAANRLPFTTKCLPRAIALHWMLHRRGRDAALVIAALSGETRGTRDDLHAWVERGGEILIGETDRPYHRLARFAFAPRRSAPASA
jgi:hypothetical protein